MMLPYTITNRSTGKDDIQGRHGSIRKFISSVLSYTISELDIALHYLYVYLSVIIYHVNQHFILPSPKPNLRLSAV